LAGPLPGEIAVPEQVIVSMTEIAESAKEGLLALAVGTGLQTVAPGPPLWTRMLRTWRHRPHRR